MAVLTSCAACGADLPEGAAFCPACGAHREASVPCGACGTPLEAGAHFCAHCGASTESPSPALCARCGVALPPSVHFCPSCGAPAAVTAPSQLSTAVEAPACAFCGAELRQGAKFCRVCGKATGPQVASAVTPQPARGTDPFARRSAPHVAAAPRTEQRTASQGILWRDLILGGGLAMALLSVFMDWITVGSLGAGPMDANSRFRIGDWLDLDKADGYAVIILAASGLAAMILPRFGSGTGARRWLVNVPMATGGLLAALAILEFQYISSEFEKYGVEYGVGLYLLGLGGVAAIVARFVPAKPIGKAPSA